MMEATEVDESGVEYSTEDIVDEALFYYKTNMLCRTFAMKGAADRLILFLTHYIHTAIKRIVGLKPKEAKAVIVAMQTEYSIMPLDKGFPFSVFFTIGGLTLESVTEEEKERFSEYSKQLRYECGMRLLEKMFAFPEEDGTASKFWTLFAKHKLLSHDCLLYTSDAADEEDSVDLGGGRIIKKKKQ
eukprot:TRINITY_DN52467_c0_g1_i2.p1 TRINITY_DN52467_c0_g1~~TRINITY_DN52467_c0_g1_i2.p1  ORF type:complete len:186 (-),score=67.04 TRINITY_DN52467_c0_g1_i2:21-578(-)